MIVDHVAEEAETPRRDLALKPSRRFRKQQHHQGGAFHGGGVARDRATLGAIRMAVEAFGDVVVIAPVAEEHYRNGATGRCGADRKVDQDRVRSSMAVHCLVEPPSRIQVIGSRAEEVCTGVPMTQLMA